uniref:Methyltransferase 4, N6-adenosine n=1 Tax=Gasterosteus aculeatus aculeatus TaxID=481459 RepID=A0AAQ4RKM8_GASAC
MSVVVRGTRGWVLDAHALVDRGYSRCRRTGGDNRTSHWTGRFKKQCFQMLKAHHSARADVGEGNTGVLHETDKASKKRKRKHSELNQGEIDSRAFHEKIRSVVLEGTTSLVASARSLGHLTGAPDAAKEPLPSPQCGLAALCEMAKELPSADDDDDQRDESAQPLVAEGGRTSHLDLFSRVTENEAQWAAVVPLMGGEYVIPPHAAFLLSDFTRIRPLVRCGRRFDLIVMDPPWENKSVKRSRRYSSLPSSQLKRLPIPTLASPNCLVVTWVTNRPSHLRFVRDELYPHWGLEVVAQWFWVKVTASGEFVFPLDSDHKKPYEVLVLGRYRCAAGDAARWPDVFRSFFSVSLVLLFVTRPLNAAYSPLRFQLSGDAGGSRGGPAFDCQRPVSPPLPEALSLGGVEAPRWRRSRVPGAVRPKSSTRVDQLGQRSAQISAHELFHPDADRRRSRGPRSRGRGRTNGAAGGPSPRPGGTDGRQTADTLSSAINPPGL